MTKKILWASLALVVAFASCKKDDPNNNGSTPTEELKLTASTDAEKVQQIEKIELTASGSRVTAAPDQVAWLVNGKQVAKGAKYTFIPPLPGNYTVILRAGNREITRKYTVAEPRFTKGAFLLNEGNGTDNVETGTLTYVDVKGKVILDSAYIHVNGTKLGHVCQDLAFANEKIYIISQNGKRNGGEGLLTIAKANTLEKIKVFNDATLEAKDPTHIAVIDSRIYLRAGDGVYLGTEDGGFKIIAGTEKAQKLRMATIGQRVFVSTSDKKLLMIQGDRVVQTLALDEKATGLALADDGNLWVSISKDGNNNQILKVSADPADFKILDKQTITPSLHNYTTASVIQAYGNSLYFGVAAWGKPVSIQKYDFTAKTNTLFVNLQESSYASEMKTYYNSLGVDPKTGYIYYAGIKGFGMDYKTNMTFVLDPQGNVLVKKDNTNSFPAGWYFIPTK